MEWKFATITLTLLERDDPKDVRGYRSVTLINILNNTFKRMTNERLI